MEFCFLSIHRRNPRSRINSSSFKSDLIHIIIIKTRCETYTRVIEIAIPFWHEEKTYDHWKIRVFFVHMEAPWNSLRKTIVLPVVHAKLSRQTGFEDISELLFFAPVRLYLDEGIL